MVFDILCSRAASTYIEQLEDRRLLSASIINTTLYVDGSNANDRICLRSDASAILVSVGGRLSSFDPALISKIRVRGLAGNDRITLSGDFGKPLFVYGNAGRDTIIGSSGADDIFGGPGDDRISARGGDDRIAGENGKDDLFGDWGDDTISGGEGEDDIFGNDGNDNLSGGDDDDYLNGGTDDDVLEDFHGADTLIGADGEDICDAADHRGDDVVDAGDDRGDEIYADWHDEVFD